MVFDQQIRRKDYVPGIVPLDQLIKTRGTLKGQLSAFLLACQVEGRTDKTIHFYRAFVTRFLEYCHPQGITTPDQVDATMVRLFLLEKKKTCGDVTLGDYFRAINRFFNWQVAEGSLSANPMRSMKPPRAPQRIVQPLTAEQIRLLLSLCDVKTFCGARNRAVVLLFLDTGLRLQELTDIQLKDVDIDTGVIIVWGKGKKQRTVRMGQVTRRAVLHYMLYRKDLLPCLWVSEERNHIGANGIRLIIRRLRDRAHLQDVRCYPHKLRHTAAINFLRNGGHEFTLQCMFGHNTLSTTRLYVRTIGQDDVIREHITASPVDNMMK